MDTTPQRVKVYLDIDGVLLANDLQPALHVHEFLQYVTWSYDCYWLTTHCKGDSSTALRRLSLVFPPETMALIQDVKPTNWETAKTEAIDLDEPFLWFDDDLYYAEKQDLINHGVLDNWISVDLAKNPGQLAAFLVSFPMPVSAEEQAGTV